MTVTEGQVLATFDRQELQVQLAESELATQEAHLAQLSEGGSQAEIEAARASHSAALATLEELRAGPSAEAMALAEADLLKAQKMLQRAQAAYDAVSSLPNIGARPESVQLEQATIDYERAKAAYELAVSGPSTAELKQAESQVASAAAHLAALTEARPSEIQAAEAAVTRAKIGLQQAQLMLEQSTLVAPFDGTATSVAELHAGDTVSPGTVIVTVADLSELQVEVTDLDEWGAANLYVDQTADLIVPALDNRSVRGRVTFIANEPTENPSGAIFYKALIALDRQEPGLRWGNSVRVRLYVAGAKGVGFR
jgi:HlyD family secretion protein